MDRRIEQAPQLQQHLTADGRHLRKVHPTLDREIQHLRRDFQAVGPRLSIETAPDQCLPPLVECLSDGNHTTIPGMPWILDIVDVALVTCKSHDGSHRMPGSSWRRPLRMDKRQLVPRLSG